MKKKLIALFLVLAMGFSLAAGLTGCRNVDDAGNAGGNNAATDNTGGEEAGGDTVETSDTFKIGIITGTASQGDEEITQANRSTAT